MTIDEAIRHCEEVAEKMNDCECAADHRQLAEWLTELKEAKRLLKAAVEDIRYCMRYYDPCEVCALLEESGVCSTTDADDCEEKYKWRCEAEALALIGKDGDTK